MVDFWRLVLQWNKSLKTKNMKKIIVKNIDVTILKFNEEDYISLTDIARIQNPFEPKDVVKTG